MTYKILYWDRGVIGGWTAAIEFNGKRHKVPSKVCNGGYCNFDSKAEAKRHAVKFAKLIVK